MSVIDFEMRPLKGETPDQQFEHIAERLTDIIYGRGAEWERDPFGNGATKIILGKSTNDFWLHPEGETEDGFQRYRLAARYASQEELQIPVQVLMWRGDVRCSATVTQDSTGDAEDPITRAKTLIREYFANGDPERAAHRKMCDLHSILNCGL